MKKIFKNPVIKHIVISELSLIVAYFIGYFTYDECGGSLCFGPDFDGMLLSFAVLPIVLIVGSILVKKQASHNQIKPVRTYLLYTLGIFLLFMSFTSMIFNKDDYYNAARERQKSRKNAQLIKLTIADEIHKVYPKAIITMPAYSDTTDVDLKGYKYNNQPDLFLEVTKWRKLKSTEALSHYSYEINVNYYFGNLEKSFATIRTSDFYFFYSSLGMSEEGIKIVNNQIKEFLKSHNIKNNVSDGYHYDHHRSKVVINTKLTLEDRKEQENLWEEFVNKYKINLTLVDITVYYKNPSDKRDYLYYDLNRGEWYEG